MADIGKEKRTKLTLLFNILSGVSVCREKEIGGEESGTELAGKKKWKNPVSGYRQSISVFGWVNLDSGKNCR